MITELVLQALDNAVTTQKPAPGVLLHTDLGTQYTSEAFTKAVQEHGMIQSFSRKGCPYDNACIVSNHSMQS
jgi:putative transposase